MEVDGPERKTTFYFPLRTGSAIHHLDVFVGFALVLLGGIHVSAALETLLWGTHALSATAAAKQQRCGVQSGCNGHAQVMRK